MNILPQSENLGSTVNIRGSHSSGGNAIRLKSKYGSRAEGDESNEEDEDFVALMNESKKKEESGSRPFQGSAGLPGSSNADGGSEFQLPAEREIARSESFQRPQDSLFESHAAPQEASSRSPPTSSFRSLEEEKQHFLYKIQRLQNRYPGRRVSMDTPLDELKYEYDRLMRQSELSASIKFQRRTLMATVSGIEYLNKSFNPLGLHLDGWSEQVMDSIEDFDQSFEQLHDKYQGTAEVSPEWNILITLLGSGFMFHLSNSLFKSVLPNVNDVAKNNPDLMNQIASAMGSAMNNQPQSPQTGLANSSQLGASLAMQAMQKKLRPSVEEDEEFTGSVEEAESVPEGFEQASALRKPLPPMARPVPVLSEDLSDIDSGGSEVSSELSMSEDGGDVRKVSQTSKRVIPTRKPRSKRPKNSVDISL